MNILSILAGLSAFTSNPTEIALVEAAGNFLITLAAHNKNTIGAGAASVVTQVGQAVESAPAAAAEVAAVAAPFLGVAA